MTGIPFALAAQAPGTIVFHGGRLIVTGCLCEHAGSQPGPHKHGHRRLVEAESCSERAMLRSERKARAFR